MMTTSVLRRLAAISLDGDECDDDCDYDDDDEDGDDDLKDGCSLGNLGRQDLKKKWDSHKKMQDKIRTGTISLD